MTAVGAAPLFETALLATFGAAIAMPAITVRADEEDRVALPAQTHSLKENRFAVNRRHASLQAGLDKGRSFVAG